MLYVVLTMPTLNKAYLFIYLFIKTFPVSTGVINIITNCFPMTHLIQTDKNENWKTSDLLKCPIYTLERMHMLHTPSDTRTRQYPHIYSYRLGIQTTN